MDDDDGDYGDHDDHRQSIHEICLARRLILSPARPEIVTVSSPREGSSSPLAPVQEEVVKEQLEEVEGKSVALTCVGSVILMLCFRLLAEYGNWHHGQLESAEAPFWTTGGLQGRRRQRQLVHVLEPGLFT
jgi:hypothetical protein